MSNIAVLGAGYVGETLARRMGTLGHTVRIANSRDPQTLSRLTSAPGLHPVWASEVPHDADIVILALHETLAAKQGPDFVKALAGVPVVIDTGNYNSRRDGDVPEILDGKPVGQWLSEQLGRPLYRVFNNIEAHFMAAGGRPLGAPDRIALPISGPNGPDLAVVHTLIEEMGFEPVYNGELSESWRHQIGTRSYCTNLDASTLRVELARAGRDQILEENQRIFFTSTESVGVTEVDGAAVMRDQAIKLREYFGDSFGDPDVNAQRLDSKYGVAPVS